MEEEMTLQEIDMKSGIYDVYINDFNFSDEEIVYLFNKKIYRISQINPDIVDNKEIFKKLKDASKFLSTVLDAISDGNARVPDRAIKTYLNKIMDYVYKDINNLNKIPAEKFYNEYKIGVLENLIIRHILINVITAEDEDEKEKYKLMIVTGESIIEQKLHDFKTRKLVRRS